MPRAGDWRPVHEPRDAFVVIDRDDYRGARAAELVEMVGFEAVCWMAGRITEGLAVPLDAGQRCTGFLLGPDEPASLAVDLRAQYPDARLVAMRREEDASDGELPAGTALLRGAPRLSALRAALIDDEALSRENPLVRALCGVSPAIVQVRRLIEHVALMDAPVLLTGGPGAGKEVVARNLHHLSDRQGGPFIAVHCETASAELLASELLGTERRGPGGAIERQRGRLELAHGGTLYLEAIDAMPFELQRELLRFLQRDTFTPVEGSAPVGVDVRVVGATRHDLEQEVAAGRFRDDLHRHLGAFPIQVPDLRARREDIPLLIAELAQRIEGRRGVTVFGDGGDDRLRLAGQCARARRCPRTAGEYASPRNRAIRGPAASDPSRRGSWRSGCRQPSRCASGGRGRIRGPLGAGGGPGDAAGVGTRRR